MIKKFESFVDELDPYGEENWGEEKLEPIRDEPGICRHCGSDNIIYHEDENYGHSIGYRYVCQECQTLGREIYNLDFIRNEIIQLNV